MWLCEANLDPVAEREVRDADLGGQSRESDLQADPSQPLWRFGPISQQSGTNRRSDGRRQQRTRARAMLLPCIVSSRRIRLKSVEHKVKG